MRLPTFAIVLTSTILLAIFLIIGYSSCVKNQCSGVVCNNKGVCAGGSCSCPPGIEGAKCDSFWYAKFTGTWTNAEEIRDSSVTSYATYKISIRGNNLVPNNFLLDSLESSDSLVCQYTGYRSFQFTSQYRGADSSFFMQSGSGSMNDAGDTINVSCTLRKNGFYRSSKMVWSR